MKTLLTCVAAMALPISVLAADVLEEITVTATRRAESISEVSSAISVVGKDAVTPVITDSLREATGVFVQQTTPGQGAVILRGLKGSAVLHLVDGMRLNNAIFRNAPTQYFSLVPSAAVERIEVVRGSPTSLYGSDAVGGVVQAVTRIPTFDEHGTRGDISVRLDTAELSRNVSGTVEFGNARYATGISADILSTGNRRVGGGSRVGPSQFESRSLRAIFSATPSDETAWFIDAQFLEQPETPRFDELVAGFGQSEPDSSVFFFKPNRRAFLHGQYRQSFSHMDWVIDAAWQRIDDDRESLGLGDDARRLEKNRSDLFGLTSRWSGDVGDTSWIAGAEVYVDTVESQRVEVLLDSGAEINLAARFPDGSDILQSAIFANAHRRFGERLQLGGGIRFSRVEVNLAATDFTSAADVDAADVSADVGAIFDLDDNYQITANAGFGFRAPNIFDLGTLGNRPGNRFNVPNTALNSEKVTQFDLGLRRFGPTATFEVAAYYLDYTDRITSVSTNTETTDGRDIVQSVNAATAQIYGLEAGFRFAVTDRLRLLGGMNLTRGEQTVGEVVEASDRVPPLSGYLRSEFALRDALLIHAGFRFADQQDRLSARDSRDNRINPAGTPGWAVLDLGATLNITTDTVVHFQVDNLLDKRFRYHGSGIDAPGRNFSVHLKTTWR